MRNLLSNTRFSSWIKCVVARLGEPGVKLFTRGGRVSPKLLMGVSFCALLVGCISLVEIARHNASKKEGKPTLAVTAAANVAPVAAKPPNELLEAIAAKPTAVIADRQKKQTAKSPAPVPRQPANSPAMPATLSYDVNLSPDAPAGFEEEEGGDAIRARGNWFYGQRAYPLGFIPPEGLQKAIEQRDLMKQRQHAAQASGANAIISFPGDALRHLMGPQPVNELFSVNAGFPTASGRVTAIAVDPSDATGNTVYIGGDFGCC